MADHAKKKPLPKGVVIGGIVTAAVAVLVVAGILLVHNGVLDTIAGFFSRPSSSELVDSSTLPPADSDVSEPEVEQTPQFRRPDKLSGVRLTAGVEYLTSAKDTAETVKKQIDGAFAAMKEWSFNTVLVPLTYSGKVLFASDTLESFPLKSADGAAFDPLAYILQTARAQELYVYGILDLRVSVDKGWDPTKAADAASMHALAAEAAGKYAFDGWMIENYSYPLKAQGDKDAFAAAGAGRTMAQFMTDGVTAAVTDAVKTIRAVSRDLYVGLLPTAVWAHKSVDSRGSDTGAVYEEYTDGRADSLSWLEAGLFDFVMVKNDRSTTHATAGFDKVLDWWADVCGRRDLPLYVSHSSDKAGAGEAGWDGDQLSKQILSCQRTPGWAGSAFNSLAALRKDTGSFATVLHKALTGGIDGEYAFKSLTFSAPKSKTVTTDESKFTFMGSTDPNFPVTMNGKKLELSDKGGFAVDVTLQAGKNTFTFVSNGKTVTYTVTYKVTVLKSVAPAPSESMTLDGGSTVGFSAIARKGATVKLTFNGKTYTLKSSPLKAEEGAGDPELSDFENYMTTVTLPGGKRGQAQALGAATFTGSYKGLAETKKSGAVTVKALPNIDAPEVVLPGVLKDLKPINPNAGGKLLAADYDVIIVNKDYIESFDGATVEDYSRPTNAYLPKGTTDVKVNEVTLGNTKYYLLGCGRRVYASDVATYITNGKITANTLKKQTVEITQSHTILKLEAAWRMPYNVQLLPQKYQKTTGTPDYSINDYGQTTEYVDVTFSYTTAVPAAAPDMTDSPLFKKAEWLKGSAANTTVLRLHLREKGQFYGYSVVWDNAGTIQFSFKHPSGIGKNPASAPLKGVRIVVDPGHGGKSSGTWGTVSGLYEKTLTLTYGKLLRDKLTALGAKVDMTRTEDVNPVMSTRTDHARNNGTDLLVSVHMNGHNNAAASGCSIHYFNEYSYDVSRRITDAMRAVEKTHNVVKRSEPLAWSPFFLCRVHDCPSLLIEYGFMTNPHNMDLLRTPAYQEKIVQASVDGILAYFRSLPTYSVTVTTTTTTTTTTATVSTTTSTSTTATATGTGSATGTASAATDSTAATGSKKEESGE